MKECCAQGCDERRTSDCLLLHQQNLDRCRHWKCKRDVQLHQESNQPVPWLARPPSEVQGTRGHSRQGQAAGKLDGALLLTVQIPGCCDWCCLEGNTRPASHRGVRSDATLEPEPLTLFLVGRTLEGTVFHLRS